MNTDPLIVGDRLWGASTRLMAALHVERIAEVGMTEAMPDMVPVFETAMEAAHAQTATAWRECVEALGAWTGLRMSMAGRCPRCGGTTPPTGRFDATGECMCHETDEAGSRAGDVGHPGDPGLF